MQINTCLKKHSILILVLLFGLSACKKAEQSQAARSTAISDAKVPEGFDWQTTRKLDLSIEITDLSGGDLLHVVSVYDDAGNLVSKGSGKPGTPFQTALTLPYSVKKLYIIKTAPDNSRNVQEIDITNSVTKTTLKMGVAGLKPAPGSSDHIASGPDCSSGCDVSVIPGTSATQVVNVVNGQTVCLGGDYTGKELIVNYGTLGGTLRICGTNVTIRAINSTYTHHEYPQDIIVASTGTVTIKSPVDMAVITINGDVSNYGSLTVYRYTRVNHYGTLLNYGTMTQLQGTISTPGMTNEAHYVLYSIADSHNYGIMNMGFLNLRNGDATVSRFINDATMTAYDIGIDNEFINLCKLTQVSYCQVAGTFRNMENAYYQGTLNFFRITNTSFKGQFLAYNNSMVSCTYLSHQGGLIQQQSGTSFFKLTTRFENQETSAHLEVKGNIGVCIGAGVTTYGPPLSASLSDGAVISCSRYIPSNTCNPGNGSASQSDADQDGIADALDDYPNDATRAFNIPGAKGVLFFEDQWPKKGDYDLNDLVIDYSYDLVTNAANKVVKVSGDFNLRAAGGTFDNGFGIEFPISRESVTGISGATLETAQSKAVAILFTSMHTELPRWNTIPSEPRSAAKIYHIDLDIATSPGIRLVDFGLGNYNPFIWNNGQENNYARGTEIHLWGKTPTDKVNTSLFGVYNDRTSLSKKTYYVSDTGYPWGIDIPDSSARYPIEGADIGTAYLQMHYWIESGGTLSREWYYLSPLSDPAYYRNESKLFTP